MVPGSLFASRYRIVRRLGAGAMGAVYEAIDGQTESRRALKIMHPHVLDRPELLARFRTEATVAGNVGSPFLVDVLAAGVDEESATPYLVMELLRGEDLGRVLARKGRLSPDEALGLLAQLAAGLSAMHRAGIVHRDLKPSNLFLENRPGEAPRLKILDFGIAKVLGEGGRDSTTAAGTPLYMAPEQFRGRGVTEATDIHALGMIAFTVLVGSAYWDEPGGEAPGLVKLALVASNGPSDAASVRAAPRGVELPAAFDAWFRRAAAREPRARFGSAGEAVRALAEALGLPAPALLRSAPAESESRGDESARLADTVPVREGADAAGLPFERTALAAGGPETATATGSSAPTRPPKSRPPDVTITGPTEIAGAPSTGTLPPQAVSTRGSARSRILGALAITALSAAGTLVWWSTASEPVAPPRPRSPLAPPGSILACPPLRAFGVEEPSGWLGAAAAATLCERARLVLGGLPSRTLLPAELLGLPARPVDGYPADPYGAPGARERAIDEARRRAAAYIDGAITRTPAGFRIQVSLRRSEDGAEIDVAISEAAALYSAVRAAMGPWVSAGSLPRAERLDPVIAEYSRAPTIEDALLLSDISFAIAHNAGTLPDECKRLDGHASALGAMFLGEWYRCAYTVGRESPKVDLPSADPGSRGAFVARARIAHMIDRVEPPDVIATLDGMLAAEASPWGKAAIASTLSCLLQASDAKRASEVALQAVLAEPKNPNGEWCAPWGQLGTVTQGTPGAEAALRAWQAWSPWDPYGWLFEGQSTSDPARALAHLQRAYLLSPLDAYVASTLADRLLAAGRRGDVRSVALALAAGKQPVHEVGSELLLVRADAGEARFAAALEGALRAMVPRKGDAGWVRAERLDIAWRALEIAGILGRSEEVADRIFAAFLAPDAPVLDATSPEVSLRLPAVCARASAGVSPRCFERFRALWRSSLPGSDAFIAGAERWSRKDLRGAAESFRPLLREPQPFVTVLPEAMLEAFEAAREPEVVSALEAAIPDRSAELGGASLAMVRAARRAARDGNTASARELAHRVVAAWKTADAAVPALEEMRRIEAKGH